jgi:flagellar hook assembly protein FlgD
LYPPLPNPARGDVQLSFDLPMRQEVHVAIYDIAGRRVRELVYAVVPTGRSSTTWDRRSDRGESVASGVYVVRLTWEGGSASRLVTLLR